jgi:hypothetical protein
MHGQPRGVTANRPMPIIEPPTDSPRLLQGDILRGVRLFATEDAWKLLGGDPVPSPHDLCLVLSRPCVATHKRHIVVAGVAKYGEIIPRDVRSFEKVHSFLADMRDGIRTPDVFYLGQIPGRRGRYGARLDAIHTVEVPTAEPELSTFLKERRIGTLNGDFVRDLHIRVFRAFASLGFEDEGWLSDDDLNWLLAAGETDLKEAEFELSQAEANKAARDAEGKQHSQSEIERLSAKAYSLQERLAPYRAEKERRP